MKRRHLAALLTIAALLVAVVPLKNMLFESSGNVNSLSEVHSSPEFIPNMRIQSDVDRDHDRIEDGLNREITDRLSNGTAQEYVNVTVMLKTEPAASDSDVFVSSGGYLTTSPWTHALYGFGGRIPYNGILVFAKQCPDVLLVEKEALGHSSVAYAARQVGARTYVWSTLGLQGDPNSSVAVIDTGIDASHPDFSPGFGDQNFSEKIVGWNNQINSTSTPFDDNGHGSHCSGLAAGDGFFSADTSGYATATWGANLGYLSAGNYSISGMMVNKTGPITVNVKWARSGGSSSSLSSLSLWYGDKTLTTASWTQVASESTPSQNTFYNLTYNVTSIPAGGYDMYHIRVGVTTGNSGTALYVTFNMTWPYTPPTDGFPAWTGIAPQAKLVGVKVLDSTGGGTSTELISGVDWIIANRMTYHITVASMSLSYGPNVTAVDSAVANLVNSGVSTVVAAGNGYSGGNYIYSPGSVDEVITAAAMNQFDNMASYSSQGGTSGYTGKTVKPDITAPGGSFFAVPLFSADSNNGDAQSKWADVQANDSAPLQGTSMATPVVAGAAEILIQAMGGYAAWNWTRSQALLPKMILLMTATETYPNLRESSTSAYSPTLDRGGKDVHEGYGRLNVDAAADAVLKTYQIGTTVSETLGMPPTLTNISVLGERQAWASNVQLVSGVKYSFTLSVPSEADYDLYLYNTTGNEYGEPVILANSTTAAVGGFENMTYTPALSGGYYVVVKRAREDTGTGQFTLMSSADAGTPPSAPEISSSTHPYENVWYSNNDSTFTWTVPSDPSGIAGYSYVLDQSPSTDPGDTVLTAGNSVSYVDVGDGVWYFHVKAENGNGIWGPTDHYRVKIDTVAPSNPNGYTSDPQMNVWSNDNTVDVSWSGTSDGSGSGVSGYSFSWDQSPSTVPDTTQDTTGTSTTSPVLSDGSSWYFHVRTGDNAGNWATDAYHVGPFKIDTTPPSTPSPDDGVSGVSSDNTPTFTWNPSTDLFSGVKGYWWTADTEPETWTTLTSVKLPVQSDGLHTFYVRAEDNAGNKGDYGRHDFQINTTVAAKSYLVVRGLDNRIYYRVYNSSSGNWGSWLSLPGATSDRPAAAVYQDQLHIVVRGSDGYSLWYGNLTDPANVATFSGWTPLDGATSSAPTLTSNGTTLCLVVRGLDDSIYYRSYAGSWGPWQTVPIGGTPDGPAATMLGNDLHILVRGMDGYSLWHCYVNLTDSSFSGWTLLSGATQSKPVLALDQAESKLFLAVRGLDDGIYWRTYSAIGQSWADWSVIPSGATPEGPAATIFGGALQIVVQGMDGSSIWQGAIDLSTTGFSGWSLLDGAAPSAPTLAN